MKMKRHHSNRRSHLPITSDGVVVSCATGVEIAESALERLEELDDAIFAALEGDAEALDRSYRVWSHAVRDVDALLLAESQAQYARHARQVWNASRRRPEESLPRAFAALEVLCMVDD